MIYLVLEGRLGNQLFEYAAAKEVQFRRGRNEKIIVDDKDLISTKCTNILSMLLLPDTEYVHEHFWNISHVYAMQRHCLTFYEWFISKKETMEKYRLEKKWQSFFNHFGLIVCTTGYVSYQLPQTENVLLMGYFQSDQYFIHIQNDLNNLFDFRTFAEKKVLSVLYDIDKKNSVCVHIRRGDYVNSEFDVCNKDYYNAAIQYMTNSQVDAQFYIFSDDICWAEENLEVKENVKYVQGNSDYEDFYLMYHCNHFIMSNSSFSWWAQFLGKFSGKKVIAPNKWKRNAMPEGIYQEGWNYINN